MRTGPHSPRRPTHCRVLPPRHQRSCQTHVVTTSAPPHGAVLPAHATPTLLCHATERPGKRLTPWSAPAAARRVAMTTHGGFIALPLSALCRDQQNQGIPGVSVRTLGTGQDTIAPPQNDHLAGSHKLTRLELACKDSDWDKFCRNSDSTGLGAVPKLTILQGSTGKITGPHFASLVLYERWRAACMAHAARLRRPLPHENALHARCMPQAPRSHTAAH